LFPRKKSPDVMLFAATILLLSIGIIMVYSASQVTAYERLDDTFYYLKKQLLWALLGITAMVSVMKIDYWKYKKWAVPFLGVAFLLLIIVLLPGVGTNVKGAQRWLGAGPLRIQPSEVIKIALVIFMSYGLSKYKDRLRYFVKGMLPFLAVLILACGLILLQPDLGTAVSAAGTVYIMLFAAGAKGKHMFYLAVAAWLQWSWRYSGTISDEQFLLFRSLERPQGTGFISFNPFMPLVQEDYLGLAWDRATRSFSTCGTAY